MTEFELLAIPLSLILGLGITNILSDVSDAVRDRERVPLHWLPFAWALIIFMFLVQYFFVLWDYYEEGMIWTWQIFGPVLLNCVILYLSAGLILPGRRNSDSASLLEDFKKHGRVALKTLALYLLMAVFMNTLGWVMLKHINGSTGDVAIWGLGQAANVICYLLLAAICIVLLSKHYRLQVVGTILFAFIQLFGLIVIWSVPGGNTGFL